MRILFISNYGEEGIGSTQEYLIRVMKRRGNEVYHLRPRDGNIVNQIIKNKIPPPDYILLFEGELNHTPEVSKLKVPKIWWFYDSMIIYQQQVEWAIETEADLVFVRDKRDVSKFREKLGAKVSWLPPGIDTLLWKPINSSNKTNDVGFIGWVSNIRGKWLNKLAEGRRSVIAHTEAPNTWGPTYFFHDKGPRLGYDEASLFYSSVKMGFHHSFTGDITWRPMEVSACKTACLSDRWDAISDMFNIGKEIIVYDDEKQMKELADYYIDHDEEREKIAKAAYKRVLEDHTWDCRLNIIEKEIKKL